ncbi:hypothetical protein ABIB66_008448 [Bradyrhizobium sp. F1.13.3]
MYIPPPFRVVDIADVHRNMREPRSATLITAMHEGVVGAMLVLLALSMRVYGRGPRDALTCARSAGGGGFLLASGALRRQKRA